MESKKAYERRAKFGTGAAPVTDDDFLRLGASHAAEYLATVNDENVERLLETYLRQNDTLAPDYFVELVRVAKHESPGYADKLLKTLKDRQSKQNGNPNFGISREPVIVKSYSGSQSIATALFQADVTKMAAEGYVPVAQSWSPGSYGCGAFLGALVLCLLLIGIVIFIYMLIVPPDGTLTVTYEHRPNEEKTCPRCAEKVKAAAKICRYCQHNFTEA
jgi:hypothetical protein